jgi:hypothetical protein
MAGGLQFVRSSCGLRSGFLLMTLAVRAAVRRANCPACRVAFDFRTISKVGLNPRPGPTRSQKSGLSVMNKHFLVASSGLWSRAGINVPKALKKHSSSEVWVHFEPEVRLCGSDKLKSTLLCISPLALPSASSCSSWRAFGGWSIRKAASRIHAPARRAAAPHEHDHRA